MGTPTLHFRHVWRIVQDGNCETRVLALQQWYAAEGDELAPVVSANGGFWNDVPVSDTDSTFDPGPI